MKQRKYKDMRGFYVIGVSVSNGYFRPGSGNPVKFTLKVVTNKNEPIYSRMGYEYTLNLSKNVQKHVYVQGYFFSQKDNLNLLIDSGGK